MLAFPLSPYDIKFREISNPREIIDVLRLMQKWLASWKSHKHDVYHAKGELVPDEKKDIVVDQKVKRVMKTLKTDKTRFSHSFNDWTMDEKVKKISGLVNVLFDCETKTAKDWLNDKTQCKFLSIQILSSLEDNKDNKNFRLQKTYKILEIIANKKYFIMDPGKMIGDSLTFYNGVIFTSNCIYLHFKNNRLQVGEDISFHPLLPLKGHPNVYFDQTI